MKILVIGGTGTIGKKVALDLSKNHEILIAGRSSGEFRVDIADPESITKLFKKTGKLDAIVNVAGEATWASFDSMEESDFYVGIRSKLMGQVNLVRIGMHYLSQKGSITLTTGILAEHPVPQTTSAAMVNGAIHSFVLALAKEELGNKRINVVAAALVEDSAERYGQFFKGQPVVSMDRVTKAYRSSVEGNMHGEILRVYS